MHGSVALQPSRRAPIAKKKNKRSNFGNIIDPKNLVCTPKTVFQYDVERNLKRSVAITIQQLELIDQQIIYICTLIWA